MSRAIVATLSDPQDRSHWAFVRDGWEAYARRCGAVVVEHVLSAGPRHASRHKEMAAAALLGFDQVLLVDPWIRVSPQAPSAFDPEPLGLSKVVETRSLDPRFNVSWARERNRRFPFLHSCPGHSSHAKCIGLVLADAYFLNFEGATADLAIDPPIMGARPAKRSQGGPEHRREVRAVALFLYNRPDLTSQVFSAIRAARPRRLFLIADGSDPARPDDSLQCAEARRRLVVDWECDVVRDFSTAHLGPRLRVESGLRAVFEHVEEAILLEDDLLPSPEFFSFCEELLEFHRSDARVLSIGGSAMHFGLIESDASYHFSRYPNSWGWATWKRAFHQYQPARPRPEGTVDTLDWLRGLLGDPLAATYWARLFEPTGTRPTWDHVWTRSGFLAGGLHVMPARNLVSNLGFRPDATHTRKPSPFANLSIEPIGFPLIHPRVERSSELDAFLEETVYSGNLARALAQVRSRFGGSTENAR